MGSTGTLVSRRDDITVGRSCYIFKLNRSTNSKCQFLDCATIAVSEHYIASFITLNAM